jgi:hypothetical protein
MLLHDARPCSAAPLIYPRVLEPESRALADVSIIASVEIYDKYFTLGRRSGLLCRPA